eukprot:1102264-Pleurochrysis_carterae.AAC.1
MGARARKFTTLAFAPALRPHMDAFAQARCTHGRGGHSEVAHGRGEGGIARASAAAAYPPAMN